MRNLIILILALSVLSSCSPDSPSGKNVEEMTQILTSKKWRFDIPTITEKVEEMKSQMDPMQNDIAVSTLSRLQFASFEFTPENKIILDLNNGNSVSTGTWVFTKEKPVALILAFTAVKAVAHKILKFDEDLIYLEANLDNGLLYPKIFIPLKEGSGVKQSEETKQEELNRGKNLSKDSTNVQLAPQE